MLPPAYYIPGNDFYFGYHDSENTLDGGDGNDSLFGGRMDDMLFGGTGDDFLSGGRGDDFLAGGDGNDYIRGGPGNDTLVGNAGTDTLIGEEGSDIFRFEQAADSLFEQADLIMDFVPGTDKIELCFAEETYRWTSWFDGTNTHLYLDNVAEFELLLSGEITLSHQDLLFGTLLSN
ncbi:MAG: M10 family metallopeptidase C-terminal domain-containing protein [Burkholderiales bacterium]